MARARQEKSARDKAAGGDVKSVSGGARGFQTDSAISGESNRERELVRWEDDGSAGGGASDTLDWGSASGGARGGAGGIGGAGSFDQFATFHRMTGKQTDF